MEGRDLTKLLSKTLLLRLIPKHLRKHKVFYDINLKEKSVGKKEEEEEEKRYVLISEWKSIGL